MGGAVQELHRLHAILDAGDLVADAALLERLHRQGRVLRIVLDQKNLDRLPQAGRMAGFIEQRLHMFLVGCEDLGHSVSSEFEVEGGPRLGRPGGQGA